MPLYRYNTFSLVDRIDLLDISGLVKGCFTVPSCIDSFPQSLIAESIGQLAAWYSIKTHAFASRPVAALVGSARYHNEARPGEKLDLYARIESCDTECVSYSGFAKSGNRLVMELKDCAGALLPLADFDEPKTVEEHYSQLLTEGVDNRNLDHAPYLIPTDLQMDDRFDLTARLEVPLCAEFFRDHFPKKPVLPATLLMQALSSMIISQLTDTSDLFSIKLAAVNDVKIRKWVYPGDHLNLVAKGYWSGCSPGLFEVSTHRDDKLIASAKMELDFI